MGASRSTSVSADTSIRRPLRGRDDFPFAPSRFPFFYGWVIAAVATLGTLASIPGQTVGVSVFTDHLLAAMSLSRVDISAAYMYGTVGSSLVLPLAGRLFDRVGARVLVTVACPALGATLLYLSQCDRLASWLEARGQALGGTPSRRLSELIVLTVGFFSVRFWGQGVLTMTSRAMLGKWFDRRRATVSAVSGVVVAGVFALAPYMLSELIGSVGWREAWWILAVAVGGGMALVGAVFYRDLPERCGLRMDGAPPEPVESASSPSGLSDERPGAEASLRDALGSYTFWVFNLALALQALAITAVTFHIVSIGSGGGLDERAAVAMFQPMAVLSVASSLGAGWLGDRCALRHLLRGMLVAMALGCAGLLDVGSPAGRWLLIVGFGVAGGLFGLLLSIAWPKFFGRRHLGSISSVSMSTMVLASAVGPWLFAVSAGRRPGDYTRGALGCVVGSLLILALSLGATERDRI